MTQKILSFDEVVDTLCQPESYQAVFHPTGTNRLMPSVAVLEEVVSRLKAVLFPGYFGKSDISAATMRYQIGSSLDTVQHLLTEQIERGECFFDNSPDCSGKAQEVVKQFLSCLPDIRSLLTTDVEAAFEGDPASKTPGEAIFCYPSIVALCHYRIAHALHKLKVNLIPRIICEMAHSQTGIDIHPGAEIGEYFFIDHGTGTVIGETCVIGRHVRLYQGVTLGAKSFPKDEDGQLIKGIARHPIVEDHVIIYSGATVLGRITIGQGAVIGGNVWITEDVPAGARISQAGGKI